ncbi:nuclear transport factor 2 family protein [Aeromicrobium sp. CF3.5]|uniref:nuclear transport factor 2 family protein n=1 Tax=Aeromicrobium sp. CF3.5 TaxID=3373078 RepID=UPI003EE724FA
MADGAADSVLTAHRALYDAVEAGDADLMTALWSDDPETSCVHPGAPILHGTSEIVRSWLVLMAQIGYIQFFLTDIEITTLPLGSAEPDTAVVTCTESILTNAPSVDEDAEPGPSDPTSFGAATAQSTSILVRHGESGSASAGSAGDWTFWLRHASPVVPPEDIEEY